MTPRTQRLIYFTVGILMMASALLYWISDIGIVFAACLAAAGLCFFAAALNVKDKKNEH